MGGTNVVAAFSPATVGTDRTRWVRHRTPHDLRDATQGKGATADPEPEAHRDGGRGPAQRADGYDAAGVGGTHPYRGSSRTTPRRHNASASSSWSRGSSIASSPHRWRAARTMAALSARPWPAAAFFSVDGHTVAVSIPRTPAISTTRDSRTYRSVAPVRRPA